MPRYGERARFYETAPASALAWRLDAAWRVITSGRFAVKVTNAGAALVNFLASRAPVSPTGGAIARLTRPELLDISFNETDRNGIDGTEFLTGIDSPSAFTIRIAKDTATVDIASNWTRSLRRDGGVTTYVFADTAATEDDFSVTVTGPAATADLTGADVTIVSTPDPATAFTAWVGAADTDVGAVGFGVADIAETESSETITLSTPWTDRRLAGYTCEFRGRTWFVQNLREVGGRRRRLEVDLVRTYEVES